jgi:MtrB/PioB family decaheme-associated outer membrane protein
MESSKEYFSVSKLTLAVQAALVALIAFPLLAVAEDTANAEAEALKHPISFVEIGAMNVSHDSAKFGEYNGLDESGVYALGNFDVRGGNAYDGSNGINRWEVKGIDLGTTSREISGTVGNQGQWNLGIGYDELRHNITDTYKTPFQGSMGKNSFFLPDTFGVIDTTQGGPAGTGTQAMTPNQLASFHTKDVHTDRENTSFSAGYNFDQQWSAQFDYNRLDQSGAKLIGIAFSPDAAGVGAGEDSATLMNPTNYKTDTFNLALNWAGDKGHVTASYFGSFFRDGYSSVSWSNPYVDNGLGNGLPPDGGVFPVDTFATAPSNNLNQINLSGGYDFTSTTKLAGGLSYGRNTQNRSFINDPLLTSVLPRSSLDGLVVTTHVDLKLTNQTTKDLALSAGLKYNERDNRTPSSTYASFNSIAGDPFGAVVNTPMSNKKTQLELAGAYRFDKRQSVRLVYEYEAVKRWCNNSLANSAQSADVLAAFPTYYTNSACVQSPESTENKLSASYKLKASNGVSLNAGYTYARRIADYNSSFYNPMQTSAEGLQNLGYRAFFDASRTEQLVKAGINWQANDKLNVGLNGRYVDDNYDATLGVQKGHTWGLNLDAAYSYSQDGTVSAYLSAQRRERDLLSAEDNSPLAAPTNIWSNRLTDDTDTIGITLKQNRLMGGKLALAGDLSYSYGTTGYSTQLKNYTSADCSSGIACGNLPDIKNEMLRLKITGIYQVDKSSKVALGYMFNKRRTNDYYYSAYQTGSTDVTVLPTDQQAPNYSVSLLAVSYIYSF